MRNKLGLMAMMAAMMGSETIEGPTYRTKPNEKRGTGHFTPKQWKKRKRRLEMTKKSRKANRS